MTRHAILCQEEFTQTDPMPLGAGSAFESSYVYGRNNPALFVDPARLRAMGGSSIDPNVIRSFTGGHGNNATISSDIKAFFVSAAKNKPRSYWKSWGVCGSGSIEVAIVSFAYSRCFIDDGNDISGVETSELPGGLQALSVGLGAGGILSNASNADKLGGESVCLDVGIEIGLGAGGEVCLGMKRQLSQVSFSVAGLRGNMNGIISVYLYASAGIGVSLALREATSSVYVALDYPQWLGHLMPRPLI